MDYKRLNSHLVLHLLVGCVILVVAIFARTAVANTMEGSGTANLVFVGVVVVLGVIYLIIISFFANSLFPRLFKKLPEPKKAKPIPDAVSTEIITETVDSTEPETPKPSNPKSMQQVREDAKLKTEEQKEADIKLFQDYAHIVVGIYMSDKEVKTLDECIRTYAMGEVVDESMKPLKTRQLDNADLFHFGWNMHNFFKTGDTQAIVADWLQAVFVNLRKLDYTTIAGKLKHNERNRYMIPIVEDIRSFMAEQES